MRQCFLIKKYIKCKFCLWCLKFIFSVAAFFYFFFEENYKTDDCRKQYAMGEYRKRFSVKNDTFFHVAAFLQRGTNLLQHFLLQKKKKRSYFP